MPQKIWDFEEEAMTSVNIVAETSEKLTREKTPPLCLQLATEHFLFFWTVETNKQAKIQSCKRKSVKKINSQNKVVMKGEHFNPF